jgi:hypothetical protein
VPTYLQKNKFQQLSTIVTETDALNDSVSIISLKTLFLDGFIEQR